MSCIQRDSNSLPQKSFATLIKDLESHVYLFNSLVLIKVSYGGEGFIIATLARIVS